MRWGETSGFPGGSTARSISSSAFDLEEREDRIKGLSFLFASSSSHHFFMERANIETGNVQLSVGEAPSWREALLLAARSCAWMAAVIDPHQLRRKNARRDEQVRGERPFFLPAGVSAQQVPSTLRRRALKLEVNTEELLAKGRKSLASDSEVVFLSAGESAKGTRVRSDERQGHNSRQKAIQKRSVATAAVLRAMWLYRAFCPR